MRVVPTRERRLQVVEWVLRSAIALQCVGAAKGVLASGSPIGSFFFLDLHLPESVTTVFDQGVACGLLLLALVALFLPRRPALYLLAGWFLIESLATAYMGGHFAAEIAPFARAVRYAAPVALVALTAADLERAKRMLTYGAAAVFAAHGIEALLLNPQFLDYLIVSVDRTTGFRMTQAVAEYHVYAIGLVDVLLAVLAVRRPSRLVLGYMAFWGFTTAGMRMLYYGPEAGYHHALIRSLNGAAPLLLLFARRIDTEAPQPIETKPAEGMGPTWPVEQS